MSLFVSLVWKREIPLPILEAGFGSMAEALLELVGHINRNR